MNNNIDNTKDNRNDFCEKLSFDDIGIIKALCGEHDENIKKINKGLGVKLNIRGNEVSIKGADPDIETAKKLFQELYFIIESGYTLGPVDVEHAIGMFKDESPVQLRDIFLDTVLVTPKKKTISPKSITQKEYINAIRRFDIVIGIGPAGTGKTYLAMTMAVAALMNKEVDRIILARPAVEAGEKLGFLPGDLFEKINPYLRPLYDALHDLMEINNATDLLHKGIIEVAPLAFMRGRTLNDSFVILDEAQNATSEQMKMFLTRLGFNSKAVITGDITQIDLPKGTGSGLIETQNILSKIKGISTVRFSDKDVVRHPLVKEIIKAYEKAENSGKKNK